MKTEDIDKKIGMPDVDKEWARFEQEIIGKETKRHSALAWALGIGIAASVALLIIYNIGKEQTEQPLMAQVEPTQPQHVSEPARVPAKEVVAEVSKPVASPRKELALAKADASATTGLDIPAREFTLPKDADIMLCAEQAGYKSFEFSPSDKNLVMHLEKSYNGYNMRLQGAQEELLAALPDFVPDENEVRLLPLGAIGGSHDSPPNDSILYLINGVPQPKENNKWLDKRSYLDYLKGQHLLVSKVMRHMNEEAKQRYIEKYGEAAKHGVIEYICVEDTLCDYYMDQHEELKASRRRVSGIVYDENDEPLAHTMIYIWHDKRVWGFETTDSLGNFTFWVPRSDVKMEFTYVGFYKAVVVEPSDTFQTIYLLPNDNFKSLKESLKF